MVHARHLRAIDEDEAATEDAPIAVGIPERFITNSAALPAAAAVASSSEAAQAETRGAQPPSAAVKPKPGPAKKPGTAAVKTPTAAVHHHKTIGPLAPTKQNRPAIVAPSKDAIAPAANATTTTVHKVQRARGVLSGLSTLQRQGNVRVQVRASRTTVKSHFRLGPLHLQVQKAFGRGAKRELKCATATTTEMLGRITLRIVNGAATLHSIKVQQPRQLLVTGADDHDPARAFVWRKSAHIADVVGAQLREAARSMMVAAPMMQQLQEQQQEMDEA